MATSRGELEEAGTRGGKREEGAASYCYCSRAQGSGVRRAICKLEEEEGGGNKILASDLKEKFKGSPFSPRLAALFLFLTSVEPDSSFFFFS